MINHGHDPDIVRWGLHLLDVCSLTNSGYCGSVTLYGADPSQVEYVTENYCENFNSGNVNIENDEVIAHALQEEFSRLATAEASSSLHPEKENMEASFLAQDWLNPSTAYPLGHETGEVGVDPIVISCTSSSIGDDSLNMDGHSCSLKIADEATLDGEVGKRLNQMVPIPHVPKINGEIPSEDEEVSDHQRLLDRLKVYDLVEFKVQGDGNCQFRSLSDQIYRNQDHHKSVRQQVVDQLRSHPDLYEGYVPMAYGDYLNKMSKNAEWGDHVTLQAAADTYGVKIFVLTSFKDTCYIEILPQNQKSNRVIFLSFWAEVHYNSIYPEGDLPAYEPRRKNRWWIF